MHKHYSCAFIDVLVMCKLDIPVLPFPTRTVYNRTFNNYEQNMKNMYTTVSSWIKCPKSATIKTYFRPINSSEKWYLLR